jgi:hypothetical protein
MIFEHVNSITMVLIYVLIVTWGLLDKNLMKVVYLISHSQNVHQHKERSVLKVLVQTKMVNAFQNIMKDVQKDTTA